MYKAPLSLIAMLLLLLSAIPAGAEIYWVDTDAYGTIVGISKEDGTRVWSGEYYPFGEQFRTPNKRMKNQRTFLGKEFEPKTGLTAVGARNYSSELGCFTSADPIGPVNPWTSMTNYEYLANPHWLNRYAYGMNNPYRYVDPDGKTPNLVTGAIGALLGAAYNAYSNYDELSGADLGRSIGVGAAAGFVAGATGFGGAIVGAGLNEINEQTIRGKDITNYDTDEIASAIAAGAVSSMFGSAVQSIELRSRGRAMLKS